MRGGSVLPRGARHSGWRGRPGRCLARSGTWRSTLELEFDLDSIEEDMELGWWGGPPCTSRVLSSLAVCALGRLGVVLDAGIVAAQRDCPMRMATRSDVARRRLL
eukprot:6834396-Pyramimonas_sp.AAC.1